MPKFLINSNYILIVILKGKILNYSKITIFYLLGSGCFQFLHRVVSVKQVEKIVLVLIGLSFSFVDLKKSSLFVQAVLVASHRMLIFQQNKSLIFACLFIFIFFFFQLLGRDLCCFSR